MVVLLGACVMVAGCVSKPVRMGAIPGRDYEVLGRSEAKSVGFLFGGLVPVMQNARFQRAYSKACRKLKGDDLINLEINERWFWCYVANGFVTNIKGDVIKYKGSSETAPAAAPAKIASAPLDK